MKQFIAVIDLNGEEYGIPILSIKYIIDFVGDAEFPPKKGPYSRIHWSNITGRSCITTIKESIINIVHRINKET